jgi:hypothetical protein
MIQQINDIKQKGFKPVVYVDELLVRNNEMVSVLRLARKLDVHISYESDTSVLSRMHKAYVYRYGSIPKTVEAMIKRKGGIIVSGNLVVED